EALGLAADAAMLVAWRDAFTGLEHLRRARELVEQGLRVELGAYECRVFLDWRDLKEDGVRPWGELCDALGGRGVPSLAEALRARELHPMPQALAALLAPERAGRLARCADEAADPAARRTLLEDARRRTRALLAEARRMPPPEGATEAAWRGDADAAARG